MPSASEIVQGIKGIIQETRGALTDPLGHTLSGSLQNIVSDLPDYQDLQSDLQTARTDADNYFLNDGNLGNLAGDVAKVGGDVDGLLGDVAGLIPVTGGFGLLASGIGFLENRVGAVVRAFSDGSLDGPSASGPQPTGDSQTDGNPPPSISDQIPVSEPPGSTPISTTPPTMPSTSDTIPPAATPLSDSTAPSSGTTTNLNVGTLNPREVQYLLNQGDTVDANALQAILNGQVNYSAGQNGAITTYGGNGQFIDPGTGDNNINLAVTGQDNSVVLRGGGADNITGFSEANGDVLSLKDVLQGSGMSISDVTAVAPYLSASVSGGTTTLSYDPTGNGGGTPIAILNGVSTSVPDLLAHDAISIN